MTALNNMNPLKRWQQQVQKKPSCSRVNQGRKWNEGEHIPKDSRCTLKLGRDRNRVGIEDIPVLIWKLTYYHRSDQI